MKFNNNFSLIFIIINFFSLINCDESFSNRLDLILNSYHNNVLKNYEESLEFKTNGTVSRFNILFNLKRYMMTLDKRSIERNIEKLKLAKEKPSYKIDESKVAEEIMKKEKIFLNEYKQLLNIIKDTNNLYFKFMRTLKKIFIVIASVVIFLTLLAIGIMIYITSPSCRKYNVLIDEKDEKNKDDKNVKNESNVYKVVKIINNFMKSDKKIE